MNGSVTQPGRVVSAADVTIAAGIAALVSALAFVGGGGLQLGPTTLVEVIAIGGSAIVVAAAVMLVGFEARVNGSVALAALAGVAVVTVFSITWSLFPSLSWLEANRTVSYVAVFAAGIAAVRLARNRWPAVLAGVLGGLAIVALYGLATKVAPGLLNSDEIYARLRAPYEYWNAVGLTGAMGVPLCMWLGTRDRVRDWVSALAYPLLGLFVVSILMSFSRGSILAAMLGAGLWLALVPHRLRGLVTLAIPVVAGGLVAAWAFSQGALADDRVALADREQYGIYFGVILVATLALLFLAGMFVARRARTRPLSETGRRRASLVAIAALALLAATGFGVIASTGSGIGGRLHDLTHEPGTPSNDANRLGEAGSVRTVYYHRAIEIWKENEFKGAGAGAFGIAQLRFRDNGAQAQHAHGYIHQTLADLGLLGIGLSMLALITWLVAASATLGMRRGRWRAPWDQQRAGMAALAIVAVVFGAHSALDWTWFVPAVAITGIFAAGWVAGRGPIGTRPVREGAPVPLDLVPGPKLPPRRAALRRLPVTLGVLAVGVLGVLVVMAPWRAERKSEDALELATAGNLAQAREAAADSRRLNPLSVAPFFDVAAIDSAADNEVAALRALQLAVQREPANPGSWDRLGQFYLYDLDRPERAIQVLRGAVFLDPYSPTIRAQLLTAIRAQQIKHQAEQAARRARRVAGEAALGGTTGLVPVPSALPVPIPGAPPATSATNP